MAILRQAYHMLHVSHADLLWNMLKLIWENSWFYQIYLILLTSTRETL